MAKKVETVPAEPILARAHVREKVAEDLSEPVSYLGVLADEGVQLLKRSLAASDRETPDIVLLPVIFRQILAFLDAVHVHLLAGATYTAVPDVRAMFEASLALEWITKGPGDRKEPRDGWRDRWARQYYVSELRQERDWKRKFIPRTPDCAKLKKAAPELVKNVLSDPEKAGAAKQRVREIGRHIQKHSELRRINSNFAPLKKKLGREPAWYRVGGPSSIGQMAQRLGRSDEYQVLYKQWSEVAHGSRTKPHVRISGGTASIEPIRGLEGLDHILNATIAIAERSILMVLSEYRPDELKRFAEKRETEWKDLRKMIQIEVKTEVLRRV